MPSTYFNPCELGANLPSIRRIFNTGSPYNVPAGHSIDLEAVKAHYEKQNAEAELKRMERLKWQAGESELLAQREAEALEHSKPKSILQRLGITAPDS